MLNAAPLVTIDNAVIEVKQNIPKLAINDEAPWTPKLTPQGARFKTVFTKKKLIIITILILFVIIIGVVVGNLITRAVTKLKNNGNGSNNDSNDSCPFQNGNGKGNGKCNDNINSCPFPNLVNDGICDANTNNLKCDFDGGDCCDSKTNGQAYLLFCEGCECLNATVSDL